MAWKLKQHVNIKEEVNSERFNSLFSRFVGGGT